MKPSIAIGQVDNLNSPSEVELMLNQVEQAEHLLLIIYLLSNRINNE